MTSARILIVEDEPMVGELIGEILKVQGYEARLALTGKEGLEQAVDWRPDLVVLDVMLPDMNGFDVCQSIRQSLGPTPPGILMLTGMMNHEARLQGFGSGTDRFLTKPFVVSTLLQELESVLTEYRDVATPGLRNQVELNVLSDSEYQSRRSSLLMHFSQSTPLSTAEIQTIATGLDDLHRRLADWARTHSADSSWRLVCSIFRDRIEFHLRCSDTAPSHERDRLHELFQLASNSDQLPFAIGLSDRTTFPDHGSVAVLTKSYPNPSIPQKP